MESKLYSKLSKRVLNILRPVSGSPAAKVNEMFTVFSDLRDPSVSGFPAARTKLSVSFTGAEPFALVFHSFLGKSLQVFPRIGKKGVSGMSTLPRSGGMVPQN